MTLFVRFGRWPAVAIGIALLGVGCHSNQAANTSTQNPGQDPAAANLAPGTQASSQGTAAPLPQPAGVPSTGPAPEAYASQQAEPQDDNGAYSPGDDESDYGEQPEYTADQAPPPLPDYDQPPAPGDDYLWTPGYWAFDPSQGYYWVPGTWVEAPYEGALWTPGYWGYRGNSYVFFPGYWGQHIGFYGGVDYGYGYTGYGYEGGYWDHNHFDYNSAVNNINDSRVHYHYDHRVDDHHDRVSFNGGSGGIQVRPKPAEIQAWREPHARPMATQQQVAQTARSNRAQFATVNHGRPTNLAESHPVQAERNVRPVPPPPMPNRATTPQREPNRTEPGRTAPTAPVHAPRPTAPVQPSPVRRQEMPERQAPQPRQEQQQQRQAVPQRSAPAARPAPSEHGAEPPQREAAPQRPAAPVRPTPEPRSAPAPERRAAPPREAAPQHPAAPQRQAAPQHQAPPPREEKKPEPHGL